MKNVLRTRTLMIFVLTLISLTTIFFIENQHSLHKVNANNKLKSAAQLELVVARSILEADVYLDIFLC